MKNTWYLTLILICTTLFANAANQHKDLPTSIQSVTVYTQGAEVTRKGAIQLTKGVHELKIPELSQYFNANSIQVGGTGDITILAVNTGFDYLRNRPMPEHIKQLKDSLEWSNGKIREFNYQSEVFDHEKKLILANQQVASETSGVTADKLRELADFYRQRLLEINTKKEAIAQEIREMNQSIQKINAQLQEWNAKQNMRYGEIYVTVLANSSTKASLTASYLVSNAGWNPNYNIRSDGMDSDLQLDYMANVYQNTGIDWSEVKLSISTGKPMNHAQKPEMHPWTLNFIDHWRSGAMQKSMSNRAYALEEVVVMDAESAPTSNQIAKQASDFTNTLEGQLAMTYEIDLEYSIPSDNKQRTVKIQELTIPAKYEYYAAPKLSQEVYLLGRMTDWSKHSLMPGQANIFFEGAFVSKTYLNTFSTKDTLNVALGVDERIEIKRNRVEDMTSKSFTGSKTIETIGIEVKVRNNKNVPIDLVLEDQHPITSNKEIDAELDSSDANAVNEDTGIMTWRMKLKPGERRKTSFQYTVKYPKERRINL